MRILVAIAALITGLGSVPLAAQTYAYEVVVEELVETGASRFVSPELARAESAALGAYGPFRVLDEDRVALVGPTDSYSPGDFAKMLEEWPEIETLLFVECPGTHDDRANLRLGRMIRERGIAAIVPEGGSVRSGAVELFLAGAEREIADEAEFAVHAWLDDRGMGAWDYAADSPEHTKYLAYYREMGMDADDAASFYAMTNSVPFEEALWLTGTEMRGWLAEDEEMADLTETEAVAAQPALPRLAYLDLGLLLY